MNLTRRGLLKALLAAPLLRLLPKINLTQRPVALDPIPMLVSEELRMRGIPIYISEHLTVTEAVVT